ncbi:hypothetical protein [Streptosporangium roseum]|nr:hypothetical protein [Streptosporangium roseum]
MTPEQIASRIRAALVELESGTLAGAAKANVMLVQLADELEAS